MDDAVTRYGLRWQVEVGDNSVRVLVGEATLGPVKLADAMVFELAEDGRIRRIRPHLRPWLALTLLALKLGRKLGRHPGIVRRALQRLSPVGLEVARQPRSWI